jgi:Uma2 family endonuclease
MSTAQTDAKPIGPASAGTLMTPEEFDAITDYDDRYRYELIHGVLVVTPIPREAEAGPNDELGMMLRQYRREHPQGSALDDTLPECYVRTNDSRRRADRVIWAGLGRRPDPRRGVPTIVVEFVSKAKRDQQRDYVEKRGEYLGIGAVEYWIIDRSLRRMTIVRNRPEGPLELTIAASETYRTELLPGFELPLSRLLTVADDWPDSE